MTENEILDIFRRHSALLEGHFILSSGLHSDRYIQCALVLQHPDVAETLCFELAAKLRHVGASVVAAPALGGVIVSYEVARALAIRALSYRSVESILKNGLDGLPLPGTESVTTIGDHANVRGARYYE